MQPQPRQLTIFDQMMPKGSDDGSIQYVRLNGELHVKIGFAKPVPVAECPKPVYVLNEIKKGEVMDLSKKDNPVKKPSPGIKPQSLPKSRRGGEGW